MREPLRRSSAAVALAAFWILTGVLTLMPQSFASATALVADAGFGAGFAKALVAAASVADIVARRAAFCCRLGAEGRGGAARLSAIYLIGLSLIAPELWTDHFGPLLKVVPMMAATLVVMAFAGEAVNAKDRMDLYLAAQVPASDRRRHPVRHRARHRLLPVPGGAEGGLAAIAATLRTVVVADYVFTATAAMPSRYRAPPRASRRLCTGQTWIALSLALYVLIGACWLPVVVLADQDARPRRSGGGGAGEPALPPPIVALARSGSGSAGRPFLRARDLLADDRQAR